MFDIITFGSATRDTFLELRRENHQILKSDKFLTGEGVCFSLGSKIEIEKLIVSTGGGGTNSAATFALQGFKTAFLGKIGKDKRGEAVLEDLEKFRVSTRFLKKDGKNPTAYSVVLFSPLGGRTILVYRGASYFLTQKDIPFKELKANWFYLAPLGGKLAKLFPPLVNFAKRNDIKVMANPGLSQLNLRKSILKPILAKVDILNLNQEEASLLTGISFKKEKELFKKLDKMIEGIAIMTKGGEGVVVSDGNYLWQAPSRDVKVVDSTGAGDAFGSGFLVGFIKKNDISYAIRVGIFNATSCIQKIGAKNGLLEEKDLKNLPKIKVRKIKL
jgi:ribokinase